MQTEARSEGKTRELCVYCNLAKHEGFCPEAEKAILKLLTKGAGN